MERKVYWNGQFIPEAEARVSVYDSAMMFGDCVFEMLRSFNKKIFKLEDHIDRLYNGIKILRIPVTMTKEEMIQAVYDTMEANKSMLSDTDEHRIMINVTRGLLSIYQDVVGCQKGPNVIIADFPLHWTVSSMGHLFDEGINAVIPSQRTIPARYLDPKIKNRSRIHYLMANIEVSEIQGKNNWALLLDEDGFISEGTGDNFFIVKNGVIITPEGRNILRGISRDYIIAMAKRKHILVIEKNIEPYDVNTADEAFMTGTPFCLLPVTHLNSLPIGNGKRGKVFDFLLRTWGKEVKVNIENQIKEYERLYGKNHGTTPYQFKGNK